MNKEQILAMDSYILLSWVNTKLRDQFKSLEDLCEDSNISTSDITQKLAKIEYIYVIERNQFSPKK